MRVVTRVKKIMRVSTRAPHLRLSSRHGARKRPRQTTEPHMDASKLDALVRQCQAVMVEYLVPGGIDAEQAMARMIELLDGPEQRDAQG